MEPRAWINPPMARGPREYAGASPIHRMQHIDPISLQTLLDAIPAPVFYKDAQERYLGCNLAFELALGVTKAQILGKTAREIAPSDLAETYHRKDEELLRTSGTQVYESAIRLADGRIHSVIFNKATFSDESQAVGGIIGVILDVTELRHAEQARQGSEAKYRALTEKMGEGMISTDAEGRFTYCNPRFLRMLDLSMTEVLGHTFFELTYGYSHEQWQERLKQRKLGVSEQYELQLKHRDGMPVDVLLSAEPLFSPQGEFTGTLGIVTDIRERKRHESAARQAHKAEGLSILAGGVAHDFNNLFQTIQGNLEMALEMASDPERARRAMQRALQSLSQAKTLSQQMLDYSGKGSSTFAATDLAELVRMHSTIFATLTGPDTEILYRLQDGLPAIEGDPGQVLQVLTALLTNADEAMGGAKGTIMVSLGELKDTDRSEGFWIEPPPEGPALLLSVADSGCGMTPQVLGRLFDPFFTTKEAGRGLGLASALGILKSHRAGLRVWSEPGQGSIFRLAFAAPKAEPGVPPTATVAASAPPRTGCILLVDDDAGVRATGAEILTDFLHYQVLVAKDGREAVEVFERHADEILAILMDATMPNMTGSEAFKAIKALRPGTRAILCSGYSDETGHKLVKEHGFASFLKKPYSIQDLKESLEKAIGG